MKKIISLFVFVSALIGGGFFVLKDAVWLEAKPYGALNIKPAFIDETKLVGQFSIILSDRKNPRLVVRHQTTGQIIFQTIPGKSFIAAARSEDTFHEARGMLSVKSKTLDLCAKQSIDSMTLVANQLRISGQLVCANESIAYQLMFEPGMAKDLLFKIALAKSSDQAKKPNHTYLIASSHQDESFYGFGEQFSYFDQKGQRLPIMVSEQGIGRGLQPISLAADLTADGAGGKWHSSYAGVPHFISSDNKSLMLETHRYAVFDFRRDDAAVIEVYDDHFSGRLIAGNSPLELIENYTAITGRMRPLPEWITKGAIIGMQGGTEKVRLTLTQLNQQETPIAAFWLQDWVGQRKTSFGKQLWWNWTLDTQRYPEWPQLTQELKAQGIQVLTYINPFLVDVEERKTTQGVAYRNLFREARAKGYLVTRADGQTYMIKNTSFSAGLLDLTNPEAWNWMKEIIKSEIIGIGSLGWMADFGEGFPMDGVTKNKVDPLDHHNAYPELWAQLNREAIDEAGIGDSATFFSRSGYTRSAKYTTLFWLGDQLVTWDQHDGLKSAITGLVSSGISGYAFNHSDIGGYTTITHPIKNYHRSKELQMRWAELAAFTTIFRTHEGNRPDENWQFNSDQETLEHFSRMAKVYACWEPYRRQLISEASQKGWPVARHPYLHYPQDAVFRHMNSQQFMLGADLMIAPVAEAGATRVKAYLPDDQWLDLWTGKAVASGVHEHAAPIGKPPVFYRKGTSAGIETRRCLEEKQLLK